MHAKVCLMRRNMLGVVTFQGLLTDNMQQRDLTAFAKLATDVATFQHLAVGAAPLTDAAPAVSRNLQVEVSAP